MRARWSLSSPSLIAVAVAAVPVSVLAVALVQWSLAHLLPPRTLPRLDFRRGLPEEARTLVVIPTLLGRYAEDVTGMVPPDRALLPLEPRPSLADYSAARGRRWTPPCCVADEHGAHRRRGARVDRLRSTPSTERPDAVRSTSSTASSAGISCEERFIGFSGAENAASSESSIEAPPRATRRPAIAGTWGIPQGLLGIVFVITLDSDTQLPMEGAHRLIGLLAHPLNRAVFDDETGRVTSGYTVVQPRVETSPSSSRRTWFSLIFAGDIGFDIYTRAVSEMYQDLFGAGIYCGKGIYAIDAFMRSVEGRVPENTLVSHDLFESVHGRAALATDIVLFEDYPSNYAAFAQRLQRWVRGDWQLVPWLFPRVPNARGERVRNTLSAIDRWKIADNLRRSLTSPSLLLLFVLGWTCLPGRAALWTALALGLLLAPILPSLARSRRMRLEAPGALCAGRRLSGARSGDGRRGDGPRAGKDMGHAKALAGVDQRGARGARHRREVAACPLLAIHARIADPGGGRRGARRLGSELVSRRGRAAAARLGAGPRDRAPGESGPALARRAPRRARSNEAPQAGAPYLALLSTRWWDRTTSGCRWTTTRRTRASRRRIGPRRPTSA